MSNHHGRSPENPNIGFVSLSDRRPLYTPLFSFMFIIFALLAGVFPRLGWAQQCVDSSFSLPGGGAIRNIGIANDPPFLGPDLRKVVVTSDGSGFIFIRDFTTLAPLPHVSTSFPALGMTEPTLLDDGSISVFLGHEDFSGLGLASRVEVDPNHLPRWLISRTEGLCFNHFVADPVLHLFSEASEDYRFLFPGGQDNVYFGTELSGCGHIHNGIYAFNAENGFLVWRFNLPLVEIDRITGMVLDEATDTLYATSDRRGPSTQDTLWAIDVLDGTLRWSQNLGPIWSPPVLRDGRLYVAGLFGDFRAVDPSDGSVIWSVAADRRQPIPLLGSLVTGTSASGDPLFVVLDALGGLRAIRDDGASGRLAWVTQLPDEVQLPQFPRNLAIDALTNTLYAGGTIDGMLYHIDLHNGKIIGSHEVDLDGERVSSVKLYRSLNTTGNELRVFAGSSTGTVKMICGGVEPIINEVNLAVGTNTASEAEGTEITVTVTTTGNEATLQTVDIVVSGASPDDYTINATTVPLVPGTVNEQLVTFTVLDDSFLENSNDTITLSLANLSAGLIPGKTTSQSISVVDNDGVGIVVAEDLVIGERAVVGIGSEIEKNVSIGDDAQLGENVFVGQGTIAGNSLSVATGAAIEKNVTMGDNVALGTNVVIGKNCVIGNNVTIGDGSQVGAGCEIGDGVAIGSAVTLGDRVTVLAGTAIPDNTTVPLRQTVPTLP